MSELLQLHPRCPAYSHFLGAMGAASATIFACIGAAYGKDQFTYSSARSVAEQVYVYTEYSAVELLPEETD